MANSSEPTEKKFDRGMTGEQSEPAFLDREKYAHDFLNDAGTSFENLSAGEQGQLLLFLDSAKPETKNALREFLVLHRENGLRSFISMEQDGGKGEIVLGFGRKIRQG